MNEIIEKAIRAWLAKHNYLYSRNEIADLAEMIKQVFIEDDGEHCNCSYKDFHEQNYPQGDE